MPDRLLSSTIVIFGAAGDLTKRKLIPALYNLYRRNDLPPETRIVGFSIEPLGADDFRAGMQRGVQEFSASTYDVRVWESFARRLTYLQGDLTNARDFVRLEEALHDLERGPADRLYYLAISPTLYPTAITNLGEAGMATEEAGQRRIVVEKPFGRDLTSAQDLNRTLHRMFGEHQIYRIDHYLGKETAQNILFFRFANSVFESVWDRSHVDNVQITVAEDVDVGHRAAYYDQSGVVRDMFQNHLLQLLALVAMEPPASFGADELRNEKVKVLRAVRPIALEDTVRAQYREYSGTARVAANSQTATYAAMRLFVDNWRWQGVPFYLRSGKALARKATEIVLQFKRPPRAMFGLPMEQECAPNLLSLCIQPDEGIHFRFETKVPGLAPKARSADMEFHYSSAFGEDSIPEAYERLLLDALQGDASLFTRSDEIEAAWRIVDRVIAGWRAEPAPPMALYPSGSWGPDASDALLKRDGYEWQLGCVHTTEWEAENDAARR